MGGSGGFGSIPDGILGDIPGIFGYSRGYTGELIFVKGGEGFCSILVMSGWAFHGFCRVFQGGIPGEYGGIGVLGGLLVDLGVFWVIFLGGILGYYFRGDSGKF